MKELFLANGGRPFYNEDLEILQETLFTLEKSFGSFSNQGFLLSGCEIFSVNPAQNQVSEGIVCIGGKILKLDNAVYENNVPNFIIADTPEDTDARTYENGNTQNSTRIYKAIISTTNSNGIALPANPNNQIRNIWQTIEDKGNLVEKIGTIKNISSAKFIEFFDEGTGLGFGEWQGWAWADGRNGTENTKDRMILGYMPDNILGNLMLGTTGGDKVVTLTPDQTAQKAISISVNEAKETTTRVPTSSNSGDPKEIVVDTVTKNITASNATQAHTNMPPYIMLPFVQKISYF